MHLGCSRCEWSGGSIVLGLQSFTGSLRFQRLMNRGRGVSDFVAIRARIVKSVTVSVKETMPCWIKQARASRGCDP